MNDRFVWVSLLGILLTWKSCQIIKDVITRIREDINRKI